MAEMAAIVFSMAIGLVLAGLLTNAVEIFTGRQSGFHMLFESGKPYIALLVTGFLAISGPLILLRSGVYFYRQREVAGGSVAVTGAVSWGFVTGLFALYIYLSLVL